jgi:DNA-directed RNA polymerase specialized sigma24 family protein
MHSKVPSPPQLLQRAAQGNQEALSALVRARKERAYRLVVALLEPELVSRAEIDMQHLADECAGTPDLLRLPPIAGEVPRARPDPAVTPQILLASWHLVLDLFRALSALPDEHREVLVLIDLEGLEGEQAAWLLKLDYAETLQRVLQARCLLREQLLSERGARPAS